jgi:hypothetical protein
VVGGVRLRLIKEGCGGFEERDDWEARQDVMEDDSDGALFFAIQNHCVSARKRPKARCHHSQALHTPTMMRRAGATVCTQAEAFDVDLSFDDVSCRTKKGGPVAEWSDEYLRC